MGIKVKLRQKAISKGRSSLYLDYYPGIHDPKTDKLIRREFLNLYLLNNPRSPVDKQQDKETMQIAEQIRMKKHNQLNKPEIYMEQERQQLKAKELGEKDFIQYFQKLAYKRYESNYDNWMSAYKYLVAFTNEKLKFADLNEKFCNDFRDYLLKAKSNRSIKMQLAQNSAASYFNKFKAALKLAFKEGLLPFDLNSRIEPIKVAETRRNYLTIEELNDLVNTECLNPLLKRAALFSALTGMRFSDIEKLTWSEVEKDPKGGYLIRYKQKKTNGEETLPISDQAFELMGVQDKAQEKVFKGLKYSAFQNKYLYQWLGAAGITKEITFHCFRHTFATLQLSNGTDIFTISKMLGHRELKTTQIYTKIVDKAKREAANKIRIKL